MAERAELEIRVDTDVHLDSETAPRQMLSALRRRLRQSSTGGTVPMLLETRDGRHRLPQGLLPWVTEACQRKEIPFEVVDRRSVVSCRAIRSRGKLDEPHRKALRQLMMRDSGVVFAPGPGRVALAVELMAARQQRSLVLTHSQSSARRWLADLRELLGLSVPHVAPLTEAGPDTRVVVGSYAALGSLPLEVLRSDYGMVVFDSLEEVESGLLMRSIRNTGARYLLGLARRTARSDQGFEHIYLTLGGVVCRLEQAISHAPLLPVYRTRLTEFARPYEGRQGYQTLLAELTKDEARCKLIADDVATEARAGHPCLVLSERRTHLERLARLFSPELTVETLTSAVGPAQRGRMIQRFEAGEVLVLLCTSQIAQDTVSTTRISRLFLTFPFTYVRKLEKPLQGLIQPFEGQQDAVLFDYHDAQMEPLVRSHAKRHKLLSRFRREVERTVRRKSQMTLPLG